mgnify:FL=1
MRVFRLENSDGAGPYRADWPDIDPYTYDVVRENYSAATNSDCPSVFGDSMPIPICYLQGPPASALFGCKSLTSLARWWRRSWDQLMPLLRANNFRVVEYEVPDDSGWAGNHQIMFVGDAAKVKKRFNLTVLDEIMPKVREEP